QAPQRQQGQQGQTGQQGQAQQGQAQQGQAGGSVTLTTEQRTKIRQTVLAGGNVPRASNVNFSINVGTVVPTSVRVVEVPSVIVDIHPQWRGVLYFVGGDEIIIVGRKHKIVASLAGCLERQNDSGAGAPSGRPFFCRPLLPTGGAAPV